MAKYEFVGSDFHRSNLAPTSKRSLWELGAQHRRYVMRYLLKRQPETDLESLGVWTAENGVEFEFPALLARYQKVHIRAIHKKGVEDIAAWQKAQDPTRLVIESLEEDLFCLALSELQKGVEEKDAEAIDAQMQKVLAQLEQVPKKLERDRYNCLASLDVMTIEMLEAGRVLFSETERLTALIKAIRKSHIEKMLFALKPGGRGLLVYQIVTSQTLPELIGQVTQRLPGLIEEAVRSQNFISGCNPATFHRWLLSEPAFQNRIRDPVVLYPWYWETRDGVAAMIACEFYKA